MLLKAGQLFYITAMLMVQVQWLVAHGAPCGNLKGTSLNILFKLILQTQNGLNLISVYVLGSYLTSIM